MVATLFNGHAQAFDERFLVSDEQYFSEHLNDIPPAWRNDILKQCLSIAREYMATPNEPPLHEILFRDFPLDTPTGRALFQLSECFLRTSNDHTRLKLIQETFSGDVWQTPSNQKTLSPYSQLLSVIAPALEELEDPPDTAHALVTTIKNKLKNQFILSAVEKALLMIAKVFVAGEDIRDVFEPVQAQIINGFHHSFDVLGEAAVTETQADHFYDKYLEAIEVLGKQGADALLAPVELSIKISALNPRYHPRYFRDIFPDLIRKLSGLMTSALANNVRLTIDAEESYTLDMQLALVLELAKRFRLPEAQLGVAVQAYQRRACDVVKYLNDLARKNETILRVRLVKGAYWDTEIRLAQKEGLDDYPVFTRKSDTDYNYLVCARALLDSVALSPQFASHNLHTLSAVLTMAEKCEREDVELQKLYGMADSVFELLKNLTQADVRIYTPVGKFDVLLPYLVRRMLENGVNSSFLNFYRQPNLSEHIRTHHQNTFLRADQTPRKKPAIPLPHDIFQPGWRASGGFHLNTLHAIDHQYHILGQEVQKLGTTTDGKDTQPSIRQVTCPFQPERVVGTIHPAHDRDLTQILVKAKVGKRVQLTTPVKVRIGIANKAAHLIESRRTQLAALLVAESGKCLVDAQNEITELAEFCRYYALQLKLMNQARQLPAPAGESNRLVYMPRGIALCISPWNFPAAIFGGQVIAAWLAGNAVLAKPASDTPLIAQAVHQCFLEAGMLPETCQLVLASGQQISDQLVGNSLVDVIALTGSWEAAKSIQSRLNERTDQLCPLIAETGGLNALLCDSSALKEQVVKDALLSAFNMAGQRCSALRILAVPHTELAHYQPLLIEAMGLLNTGSPLRPETDVGPVINLAQQKALTAYIDAQPREAILFQGQKPDSSGYWVPPTLIYLKQPEALNQEIFGPILHLVSYNEAHPEDFIRTLNKKGYGLTFGIHSRSRQLIQTVSELVRAGNVYINQPIIGARVGSQPFGGVGLSGTGPKAGGPDYLKRFCYEKTVSENIAASGGDPSLFNRYGQ